MCLSLNMLVALRLMRLPRNIKTSDISVEYEVCIFIVTFQIETVYLVSAKSVVGIWNSKAAIRHFKVILCLFFLWQCVFSGILDGILLVWIFIALVIVSVSTQSFYILNYFHNLFWGQTDVLLDIWALNIISSKSIAGFLSVVFVKIVSGSSNKVMLEYILSKTSSTVGNHTSKELFCSIYISEAFKPFLNKTLSSICPWNALGET